MGLSDATRDSQTETRSGYLIFYGRASVEPLKDPCLFLRGYAWPVPSVNRDSGLGVKRQLRSSRLCS